MTVVQQIDWVDLLSGAGDAELDAIDAALDRFPEGCTGRCADIRESLLLIRSRWPLARGDIRFKDGFANAETIAVGGFGRFHAWAISDTFMEMAGGLGNTPQEARAQAMLHLQMEINEQVRAC